LKIVITGGAGFIGSHLAEKFLADANEVVVLDDFSSGKRENLARVDFNSLTLVSAGINDQDAVTKALDGADLVVHLAAVVSVQRSIVEPAFVSRVNVGGTQNVLECAVKKGVKKFVFASSAAVYGDARFLPISEDADLSPISPYGFTKLEGEKQILKYEEELGLDATILRLFNVYGPRSYGGDYSNVISKFAERLSRFEGPIINGDGQQTRDLVYVEDVVRALVLASKPKKNGHSSIYNVGSGRHATIEDLAMLESKLVIGENVLVPLDYRPPIKGDIRHSYADISRIKSELGYEPRFGLEWGLKKYLAWYFPSLSEKQLASQEVRVPHYMQNS
jgi:nucleoside-diphosphate-sugar epimerase